MFIAKRKGASLSSMGDKVYKIGLIIGVLFHIILFAVWQKYVIKVPKFKKQKVVEVIDIPPTLNMKYTKFVEPDIPRPEIEIISDKLEKECVNLDEIPDWGISLPPKTEHQLFVTSYDKSPKLIKKIEPIYPELEHQSRTRIGTVILLVNIGIDGKVKKVKLLKGLSEGVIKQLWMLLNNGFMSQLTNIINQCQFGFFNLYLLN